VHVQDRLHYRLRLVQVKMVSRRDDLVEAALSKGGEAGLQIIQDLLFLR
jgi:hypothetical protein